MTLSAMVEIPLLQAHRKPVMPAQTGIQCGGRRGKDSKSQSLDSRLRGKDGRGSRLLLDVFIPRFRAEGCSVL